MLNDEFVCVAIDCSVYQQQQDKAGEFFRKIAEQGHYAGRTKPTGTRQGEYVCTPDGELLGSINSTTAREVSGVTYQALRKWKFQYVDEKYTPVSNKFERDKRFDINPTKQTIVLRESMRDLPRRNQQPVDSWRHNHDHVWLTESESMAFIPDELTVDAEKSIDDKIANRIALYHLVDSVRGSSSPWKPGDLETCELKTRISDVNDDEIRLTLSGIMKVNQKPTGELNPFSNKRITKDRGLNLKITGRLVLDRKSNTYSRFDIIAVGDRWGADVYNHRQNDLDRAMIGFAFELADPKSANVAPVFARRGGYFEK